LRAPIQMEEDRMYLLAMNRSEISWKRNGFLWRNKHQVITSRAVMIRLLPDREQLRLIALAEESGALVPNISAKEALEASKPIPAIIAIEPSE